MEQEAMREEQKENSVAFNWLDLGYESNVDDQTVLCECMKVDGSHSQSLNTLHCLSCSVWCMRRQKWKAKKKRKNSK